MDFKPFPKIPRLSREVIITEKIDGTNASVWLFPHAEIALPNEEFMSTVLCSTYGPLGDFFVKAGSRNRFLNPGKGTDNFGFAMWVADNANDLAALGAGAHYGEWWGQGIQRGYGLDERRFSLFNAGRWTKPHMPTGQGEAAWDYSKEVVPNCCHVVPVLYTGLFNDTAVNRAMEGIAGFSAAAPGYDNPEGIIVYHTAARQCFKKTFERDHAGKDAS
jgi:hypothetical protein